ncbi:MAG TPA: LD-carboxypeptidase [Bdellovibrionales bacterium]|nr:LD-carboxypeptidase [Bdellovibrionales bacterium]
MSSLRPGDIVDVIAPASRCSDKELRDGVRALRELGLKPRVPKNIFGRTKFFANTDRERLKQLKKALDAKDSKMIWCVRGGYGAIRLMPEIARWPRPQRNKIFLGYSDICTLHAHFNRKWNWPTLHGPLLDRLGRGAMAPGEKRALLRLIFGRAEGIEFKNLKALNRPARQTRRLSGRVIGGNLTVIQSGLGTKAALKPRKGDILFLEDTGERPYRLDRMLQQLQQAGLFKNVRAVVLGHFQLNDAKERRLIWSEVMPRFAESLAVPVLAGLPVGHDVKKQYPLPFNTLAELRTGARASLSVRSGIR